MRLPDFSSRPRQRVVAERGRRYKNAMRLHAEMIAEHDGVTGREAAPPDDWSDSVVDWSSAIDLGKVFVCPTLTPLFYSTAYRELTGEQQLRYNQLSAISFIDLILFFERSFTASLEALLRQDGRLSDSFRADIQDFRDDERRHCQLWERLNRASTARGRKTHDYRIVRVGRPLCILLRMSTCRPRTFPVVVLMMLTLEEHSIEISRRCARVAADVLEHHYRDAFRAHLLDESVHVQVDRRILNELIEPLSPILRRLNAALFRLFIRKLWLRPALAAVRVVQALVAEFQELQSIQPRLLQGLNEAGNSPEYRQMMLSSESAPLLFGLLRRYPEFCPKEVRIDRQVPAGGPKV
jgi:P-aminobenzoate N-oxygenase AurF